MDRVPEPRLSATPGTPNVVLIGVDALSPETYNPASATEEAEKAQAAVNRQRYEASVKQLIEQADSMTEGGNN